MKRLYAPKNTIDPAAEFFQSAAETAPQPPLIPQSESKSKLPHKPQPVVEELDIETHKPAESKIVPQPQHDVLNLLEPDKSEKLGDLDFVFAPQSGPLPPAPAPGPGPAVSVSVAPPAGKLSEETKRVRLSSSNSGPNSNADKRKEDIFSIFAPTAEQPTEIDKDRFKSCPSTNKYAMFDQLFAPPNTAFHPAGNGNPLGPQPWPAYNPASYAAFKSNPTPYRAPQPVPQSVPRQPAPQFPKPTSLAPPLSTLGMTQPAPTKGKAFEDILPPDF